MIRAILFAFAVAASASPAFAFDRDDVIGEWVTEWANARGEAPTGGGPLIIRADSSPDGLDGVTPAAGWDGVMTGEVSEENGRVVWSGHWASIWPEGATMGTFRLVFSDADTFTGVWSTDDGDVRDAAWNGRRNRAEAN